MSFNAVLLRKIREGKSMKLRDLAALLGITRNYLYLLESGQKKPGRDLLGKMSGVLGITADELLRERTENGDADGHENPLLPEATLIAVQYMEKYEREHGRHLLTQKRLTEVKHENARLAMRLKFQEGFVDFLCADLSGSEKNTKLREYVIPLAHEGKMTFSELVIATGENRATILNWLNGSKQFFECKYAEGGQIMASFPGEAGLKLCCFDCRDFDTGLCAGHGKENPPENLGVLIDRLETYGIFNKIEQAQIAEHGYGIQLSTQEISEYIYRYRRKAHIPHGVFYFDPSMSRKKDDNNRN
jgi:transcriptional regulator with XRE-family HTH domain